MNKPTEFDPTKLQADIREGRTIVSIAAEHGVSPSAVRSAIVRLDIDTGWASLQPVIERCPELGDKKWLRLQHVKYGWSVTAIARRFRVSLIAVNDALRRAGIEPRHDGEPRYNDGPLRDVDWLTARYQQVPATVIADELGVSRTTVHRALKRHRIPTNPAWQRMGARSLRTPAQPDS